jgi:hypothetical protein
MSYPAFTSLTEAVSHLNASGPDSNGNYTVYGLPIASASMQTQIDHANKYISSLVPSLTGPGSTDLREASAELAALDLACMGILVTASGGMLLGAADYKLGDLFVTKGTVGKFEFQNAVQSYQDSFNRNVTNLSTVALGAKAALGYRVPRKEPFFE